MFTKKERTRRGFISWFVKKKNRRLRDHTSATTISHGIFSKVRGVVRELWAVVISAALSLRPKLYWALRIVGVVGAIGLLATIAVGTRHFLLTSKHFSVRSISFSQVKHVSKAELDQIVHSYHGKNIFQVELDRIEKELSAHPDIRFVRVKRQLPDLLRVEIIEFQPAVIVDMDGLYLADDRGVVYKRITNEDHALFPVVVGISRIFYQSHSQKIHALLKQVSDMLRSYGLVAREHWPRIVEVRLQVNEKYTDRLDGFILLTDAGTEIWLDGESMKPTPQLWGYFESVWKHIQHKHKVPSVILMNNRTYPDRIVVRYE